MSLKKRLLFSNLENRLEKMGCFIYYSYLNEDKKKVYSHHSQICILTISFKKQFLPQLFTPNLKTIQNPCLSLDPGWF
ncbi:TPA: hypothetical protein ACL8A9_002160, partial [Streptococcus pneumoniae]